MRNLSKENNRYVYRFQPKTLRQCTSEKRISIALSPVKDTQVRVGNYKFSIENVLGKGYSSTVYKGTEIGKQHIKYAIKAIDMKKFRGSSLEMLQTEISIHSGLQHENIVKCYDVVKTSHHYYIILEYCPHGSLMDYINEKKKVGEKIALEIMDQLSSAYSYLIEQGIIHRDLKPANILRVGNKWKIADFGFSIKSRFELLDRINVGTPLYMPLEALTRNHYSYKTDIFALGIILYEMLTGRTPWECRTEQQLLQKMVEQQIQIPKYVKSTVITNFIMKACQTQDSKRFTVDQFKQYNFKQFELLRRRSTLLSNTSYTRLISPRKSIRSSETTEQNSSKSTDDQEKQNCEILKNQLQLCRSLYYMAINIESFLLDNRTKQILILTIYKHMMKLIKILENKKVNSFNLKSWNNFKSNKKYKDLINQFSEFRTKYEKEYLDYIKQVQIASIRAVNRKFPELSHACVLSKRFYDELHSFILFILKEQNHQISLIRNKNFQCFEDKIQALNSLYQYLKAIEFKKVQIEGNDIQGSIEMQRINVTQNYTQTTLTRADYAKLRKLLKSTIQ